jgi:dTDP-4-amino-4,6-dideoxygalactose transaminase
VDLGYNYRLNDVQCTLGLSQLRRAEELLWRRYQLVQCYLGLLARYPGVWLPAVVPACQHAYHLFVVQVKNRDQVYASMRRAGIGVNVHHIPVHLQPYYRQRFGFKRGDLPVAEDAYDHLLTLPLFPAMRTEDVELVASALQEAMVENG